MDLSAGIRCSLIFAIMFIIYFCINGFAVEIDSILHNRTTYDSSLAIKMKGVKWLFTRCKKPTEEIYLIVFLFELINLIIFAGASVCFLLCFILQNEVIFLTQGIYLLGYILYLLIVAVTRHFFQGKYKNPTMFR